MTSTSPQKGAEISWMKWGSKVIILPPWFVHKALELKMMRRKKNGEVDSLLTPEHKPSENTSNSSQV